MLWLATNIIRELGAYGRTLISNENYHNALWLATKTIRRSGLHERISKGLRTDLLTKIVTLAAKPLRGRLPQKRIRLLRSFNFPLKYSSLPSTILSELTNFAKGNKETTVHYKKWYAGDFINYTVRREKTDSCISGLIVYCIKLSRKGL